jgi:hypothetical protein
LAERDDEEEATEVWKRKGSAVWFEASLRKELKACFESNGKHEHVFFVSQLAELETGKIMGYLTVSNFIKGTLNDQIKKLEMNACQHPYEVPRRKGHFSLY